jgi:ribosome-binding factor A
MAGRRRSGGRPYRRTTRVNELVREIVADELQVIGDDRLELVAITGVDVDAELRTGTVYFDTAVGDDSNDVVVLGALAEHRVRLQRAIGNQARMRRTPELRFRPDEGVRAGQRVEHILRGLDDGDDVPDVDAGPDPDPDDLT